ncbi:hypothetical protein [Bythopirellula polymerisocia]|uniref:hypothetical protein n=1 Tax=Bythopirellula polymerisocia TaxID=2528003 RepID=UPI001E5CB191|nr:hypothetical protein [Bythopirellula polymerisocia]
MDHSQWLSSQSNMQRCGFGEDTACSSPDPLAAETDATALSCRLLEVVSVWSTEASWSVCDRSRRVSSMAPNPLCKVTSTSDWHKAEYVPGSSSGV